MISFPNISYLAIMKPTTILSLAAATITTATASNAHEVAGLIVRAMDPATMDPARLSVLSVLKTAMPSPTGTATDIALPTGDVAPQWYKDLPADIMVLLAQMYPATPTAAVSETSPLAESRSSFEIQDSTASPSQTTLTRSLEVASVTASAAAWGTGYSNGSVAVSTGSLTPNVTGTTGGRTASTSGTGVATGKPGLELPGTSAGTRRSTTTSTAVGAAFGLLIAAGSLITWA